MAACLCLARRPVRSLAVALACLLAAGCSLSADDPTDAPAAPSSTAEGAGVVTPDDPTWVPAAPAVRPAAWATPLTRPGLPNLYRVDEGLYRGAQPDDHGFASLSELGIETVVNLRSTHSDRRVCAAAGLDYEKISVQAWEYEPEEIGEFLAVATDPARRPVFVHCQHGADRTGLMIAMYRILVQGWSREDAIAEMTSDDFGFHAVWGNLVRGIRGADLESLAMSVHASMRR